MENREANETVVCSFRKEGDLLFGVVLKFCIWYCAPVNIALIKRFKCTHQSILFTSGSPGREILSQYAEIDRLGSFIFLVSKKLLPIVAVQISDIIGKCVKVTGKTYDYVIKIPNSFECH